VPLLLDSETANMATHIEFILSNNSLDRRGGRQASRLMYTIYQCQSRAIKGVQNIVCLSQEESKSLNTFSQVLHLCVCDFQTSRNNVGILLNPHLSLPPSKVASQSLYHAVLPSTIA